MWRMTSIEWSKVGKRGPPRKKEVKKGGEGGLSSTPFPERAIPNRYKLLSDRPTLFSGEGRSSSSPLPPLVLSFARESREEEEDRGNLDPAVSPSSSSSPFSSVYLFSDLFASSPATKEEEEEGDPSFPATAILDLLEAAAAEKRV